jgi:hypothetical protein
MEAMAGWDGGNGLTGWKQLLLGMEAMALLDKSKQWHTVLAKIAAMARPDGNSNKKGSSYHLRTVRIGINSSLLYMFEVSAINQVDEDTGNILGRS